MVNSQTFLQFHIEKIEVFEALLQLVLSGGDQWINGVIATFVGSH